MKVFIPMETVPVGTYIMDDAAFVEYEQARAVVEGSDHDGYVRALELVERAATWKARRLFPDGLEALVVSGDAEDTFSVEANLGPSDMTVAADLDYAHALGIAHALDAVYGCGVYDEAGGLL